MSTTVRTKFIRLAVCCIGAVLGSQPVLAQRDPTRAPPEASVAAIPAGTAPSGGAAQLPSLGDLGLTVLVRDGTAYLASATRLYAQGQTVGGYKIERIAETEIWLRNGKELRKVPRFAGIERRAVATESLTQ